ncbi:unnamed protein product [Caenorhabditis brenneri]
MADNRFPLFRLPFLALCMIMEFYGPHEIIQLSFCSKRSLRVAKKCWKKRAVVETYLYVKRIPSVNVHFLDFRFYSRFVILKARDLKDQQSHNIRIGDAVVPTIHEETETVTYWEDTILGIEHIVSFIKDLFDVPITKIYLNSQGYKNEFIDTMDCIMKVQESVQDCTLDTISPIEECLTHLLNRCKITGELAVHQEPARQFRNEWNIHLDSMYITSGPCITFQNLTNIDCQFLELHHSRLTSEDANQFLKHWQNGGNSRIRYARIGINSMKRDVVTAGIETVRQLEALRRLYRTRRNYTIIRSGGLDIQRNDGTIGTVFMLSNFFEFGVDPIKVFSD